MEDKEIKKEEANVAEEVTKDFEPTEGAQEAGSEDTKKKVRNLNKKLKLRSLKLNLKRLRLIQKKTVKLIC